MLDRNSIKKGVYLIDKKDKEVIIVVEVYDNIVEFELVRERKAKSYCRYIVTLNSLNNSHVLITNNKMTKVLYG